jgi:hypothetical protein
MRTPAAPARFVPGLALLAIVAPADAARAAAAPVTAEQALENYREKFESVDEIGCPRKRSPDEIVVCGQRDGPDPNRLPLPVAREPGKPVPGEPIGGAAFTCLKSCYQPVNVNLISAAKTGGRIIDRILHPD